METRNWLVEIGVARFFRYSYGGILIFLLASIVEPTFVAGIVSSLGSILAPLVALVIGIGIYVIHRRVVGELLLYPILHVIHFVWNRVLGRRGRKSFETLDYLHSLGVNFFELRSAYAAWRESGITKTKTENINVAHSELHVLWITVDQLIVTILYVHFGQHGNITVYSWVALFIALAAAIADINQHATETRLMMVAEKQGKVSKLLQDRGFITRPVKRKTKRKKKRE